MSTAKEFLTYDQLKQTVVELTGKLINIGRSLTWNRISDTCLYILSLDEQFGGNVLEEQRLRKLRNDQIGPKSIDDIMPELVKLYPGLHDIKLFVYKASAKYTVIEIRYYPKSFLQPDYRETMMYEPSMWHVKVALPNYRYNEREKFDINWHHHHISIRLRFFWKRIIHKVNRMLNRGDLLPFGK